MDSHFGSSSSLVRVLAAIASVVATVGLFGAVALGLTGEGERGVLAQQSDRATVQATTTA